MTSKPQGNSSELWSLLYQIKKNFQSGFNSFRHFLLLCLYLVGAREHCQAHEGLSFSPNYATNEPYNLGEVTPLSGMDISHLWEQKVELKIFSFFYIPKILCFQEHEPTYLLFIIFYFCVMLIRFFDFMINTQACTIFGLLCFKHG